MHHYEYLAPGVVLAALGFIALFVLLVSQGAMNKSKQGAATRDLARARAGPGKKRWFVFAVLAMLLGFEGAREARVRRVCV